MKRIAIIAVAVLAALSLVGCDKPTKTFEAPHVASMQIPSTLTVEKLETPIENLEDEGSGTYIIKGNANGTECRFTARYQNSSYSEFKDPPQIKSIASEVTGHLLEHAEAVSDGSYSSSTTFNSNPDGAECSIYRYEYREYVKNTNPLKKDSGYTDRREYVAYVRKGNNLSLTVSTDNDASVEEGKILKQIMETIAVY